MNLKSHYNSDRKPIKVKSVSFSWSQSRRKLFELCKRAYFYHYYGSIGGWDRYAPQEVLHLYSLKHLRNAEEWALDVFSKAVKNIFMQKRPMAYPNHKAMEQLLCRKIQQFYQKGYAELICENWKNDAKTLNLFEVYYGTDPNKEDNVLKYVKQRLNQHISNFTQSGLFTHLSDIDNVKYKQFQSPQNFELGAQEVWVAPSLIWQDENRLKILALKLGSPYSLESINLSSNLFALMSEQKFNVQPEQVDVIFYFTGEVNEPSELIVSDTVFDRKTTIIEITNSSEQMLNMLYPDGTVCEDDFPGWHISREHVCASCKFKEFCQIKPS